MKLGDWVEAEGGGEGLRNGWMREGTGLTDWEGDEGEGFGVSRVGRGQRFQGILKGDREGEAEHRGLDD